MKAVDANLLDLLKKATQSVVPIYQRIYSWDYAECEQSGRTSSVRGVVIAVALLKDTAKTEVRVPYTAEVLNHWCIESLDAWPC